MENSEISTEYRELINGMEAKLKRKLKARGITYATDEDISDEINDAIYAVNDRRRFDSTPLVFFEKKYTSLIIDLALVSITKYGAEGEKSHSENGIGRVYDTSGQYPEALMSRIVPLAKAR